MDINNSHYMPSHTNLQIYNEIIISLIHFPSLISPEFKLNTTKLI